MLSSRSSTRRALRHPVTAALLLATGLLVGACSSESKTPDVSAPVTTEPGSTGPDLPLPEQPDQMPSVANLLTPRLGSTGGVCVDKELVALVGAGAINKVKSAKTAKELFAALKLTPTQVEKLVDSTFRCVDSAVLAGVSVGQRPDGASAPESPIGVSERTRACVETVIEASDVVRSRYVVEFSGLEDLADRNPAAWEALSTEISTACAVIIAPEALSGEAR